MSTLSLIRNEIERLERQSEATGLNLEDVRKLEILIRSGQSLLAAPSPLLEPEDDTAAAAEALLSDAEVLAALKANKD